MKTLSVNGVKVNNKENFSKRNVNGIKNIVHQVFPGVWVENMGNSRSFMVEVKNLPLHVLRLEKLGFIVHPKQSTSGCLLIETH